MAASSTARCSGFGLTAQPISFLYSEFGVAIGMVNVLLPFLVLPLFAAMLRVDERLLQVAASLGAPRAPSSGGSSSRSPCRR